MSMRRYSQVSLLYSNTGCKSSTEAQFASVLSFGFFLQSDKLKSSRKLEQMSVRLVNSPNITHK